MTKNRNDDSLIYGRVQPHSRELEDAVLGAVLTDSSCIDVVMNNLIVDDFYFEVNQRIFQVYQSLIEKRHKIDLVTVVTERKSLGFNDVVSVTDITNLANKVASNENIESHIEFLKSDSIKRSLIQISTEAITQAFNDETDSITMLSNLINKSKDLQNRTIIQRDVTFKEKFFAAHDECFRNSTKETVGTKSGFDKFDKLTSGFAGPDFTILAAGPGEGKSTFALNVAKHISMNYGDVIYFSYEMKENQLIWKLMSDDLDMPISQIRLGKFEEGYLNKTEMYNAKLHIYDNGSLTIRELCGIVKMQSKKLDIKLIVIDYLQLIKIGAYHRKFANKTDEVTVISNALKQLAMEVNLPILALSQLSRKEGRRGYNKSDLRDSGALEQDADNIIMIFRPFEHDLKKYDLPGKDVVCDEMTAIINLEKWRLGQTGEFEMKFNGRCSRFEDIKEEQTPF